MQGLNVFLMSNMLP